MDFNIVTFHTAKNHGAVLQAYALQEFVSSLGFSAGIYNYVPPKALSGVGIKGKILSTIRKLHEKDFNLQEYRFLEFVDSNLSLNTEEDSKIFVTGSDQVWSPSNSIDATYFLKDVGVNSFRISYAASLGKSKIPLTMLDTYKQYLSSFDMVSVREEDAKEILSTLFEGEISVNLDPTLLHSADFWKKQMRPIEGLPSDFIVVYALSRLKNINNVLKWLKRKYKCKVVLIDDRGLMSFYVDNDICLRNVGPREFLWLINKAKSVVTTSFHGTVFSLIFKKEFYSIVNPAMPSRINNLLARFNIRPINATDTEFVEPNIDWDLVDAVISEEKTKSAAYINSAYKLSLHKEKKPVVGTVLDIKDKCTGCTLCTSICPTGAIKMQLNSQGFFEPDIDDALCVKCSKCKRECPTICKTVFSRKKAYYGCHKDSNVCYESSSGGAFRALADEVLSCGGVVYGAVYNDRWRSVDILSTDSRPIDDLQKSKYTVSNPSGMYEKIESELKTGRKVLVCAAPCQIAALTSYLKEDYENLIKCDFVCRGMASLSFYRQHLDMLEKQFNSEIDELNFRYKTKGSKKTVFYIKFANGKTRKVKSIFDSYYKCFGVKHVSVRNACISCEFRHKHASDITLADFWGYKAAGVSMDDRGLSLIVANSQKGIKAIENAQNLDKHLIDLKYSDYAFTNRAPNIQLKKRRDEFFYCAEQVGFETAAQNLYPPTMLAFVKDIVKSKLRIK